MFLSLHGRSAPVPFMPEPRENASYLKGAQARRGQHLQVQRSKMDLQIVPGKGPAHDTNMFVLVSAANA